ncbi:response regulator transcription factor [Patescibacteria group bacterium]|nr:response regulator transcription factor [Patescibacteria group bacterium]
MRLLIIEDDKDLAKSLKQTLSSAYLVDLAFTGKSGSYQSLVNKYDLIILDLVLPDQDGLEVCRQIRERGGKTPILVLTGQCELSNKVDTLDSGADDYLTKPFHLSELQARIRALLRRSPATLAPSVLKVKDLVINTVSREAQRGAQVLRLRRKEFDLLEYLMKNRGRVVTREMIMEHVWDSHSELVTNSIDVHIKHLRDQVDRSFPQRLIQTIHGIGYKIEG